MKMLHQDITSVGHKARATILFGIGGGFMNLPRQYFCDNSIRRSKNVFDSPRANM